MGAGLRAVACGIAVALVTACAPLSPEGAGADIEAPTGPIDPTAVVRYADIYGPTSFDPHRSSISQELRHLIPVYDRLMHLTPAGDPMPGLAESWEFRAGGTELHLQLRAGVTFHDGTPFDAAAVVANLERALTLEGSAVAGGLRSIERAEALDPRRVVLTLTRVDPTLPAVLTGQAGAMISPAAFDDEGLDLAPVGTGMYRVAEHRPDQLIVYERFDGYWDRAAEGGADRIELRVLADSATRMNALRTGQVDAALIDARQATQAKSAQLRVYSATGRTYILLYTNRTHPALENRLVRRAMNLAVDREAIVEGILAGYGTPTVQPFAPDSWAHNPEYPPAHYPYDPDRARALLAEAGYADGFELEMLTTPGLANYALTAEAVQQMYAQVGIRVRLRAVEPVQTATFFTESQGNLMASQWGGRPDPSTTLGLLFTPNGFNNPGGHTTPEMERLQRAALSTVDPRARQEAVRAGVAEAVEQAFQVPIAHDFNVFAMNDEVGRFGTIAGSLDLRIMGLRPEPVE